MKVYYDESYKTLIGYEGAMLPSTTELNLAKRGCFDLYTITNISFMDLAISMNLRPNLYAVSRSNLAVRDEDLESFENATLFFKKVEHPSVVTDSPTEHAKESSSMSS